MLPYPCVPYEIFLRYAIFTCSNNREVNDFLRDNFLPIIEDQYLDLRRDMMVKSTRKRRVRESIRGECKLPQNTMSFKNMLEWLVETGLIFPFVYFNPQFLKKYKHIEVKVLKEVFLLALHPMLRRIHNCAVFFKDSKEFQQWFPVRCSPQAFEWYRYIFFNPEVMESEGDWIDYFRKLDKSEAKLYDAAKKENVKFCIWMLGGIPAIGLSDLQENLQSISYWSTMERVRTDFIGGQIEDRGDPEAKRWARLGIDVMKAAPPQALPPAHLEDQDKFEQIVDAEEIDDADIQTEIPIFKGNIEGRKKGSKKSESDEVNLQ